MQKCLFISTIYRPKVGGIELCLENIIKRLPKDKVALLTQREAQDQEFDLKEQYKIYRRNLESSYLKPRWLLSPFITLKIARRERVQCVHAAHGFASYFAAWFLKRVCGLPYFVWAYGLDILSMQKSPWMRRWVRRIYRQADGGIANSNFTKRLMCRLGIPGKKIHVVYPGVDTDFYKPGLDVGKTRLKYHISQNKFILLSVSRLVARKGFDLVIRALPQVLEKYPDLVYVLGGKGPDEARLRRLVRSYKNPEHKKAVQFLGFVEKRDLPSLYNLADIFLMPSRFIKSRGDVEGFGMVFLEAGACACPVIGGRSGGIPEAILEGKTGFLTDPQDPQDLAFKVMRLLRDKDLRERMGKAGRQRATYEFNWEKIVENFQSTMSSFEE